MQESFPDELSGEEYLIFLEVMPEYVTFQNTIIPRLKRFAAGRSSSRLSVLELGIGPGNTTEILLKADPRIAVTGVDLSPAMLTLARARLAEHIGTRVTVQQADAKTFLESSGAAYDAIVAGGFLHNFPRTDRQGYFAAIHSALAPGGLLLVSDKISPDDEGTFRRAYGTELSLMLPRLERMGRRDLYEKWASHYRRDAQPEIIMRESGAIDDACAAGFSPVEMAGRKYLMGLLVAQK